MDRGPSVAQSLSEGKKTDKHRKSYYHALPGSVAHPKGHGSLVLTNNFFRKVGASEVGAPLPYEGGALRRESWIRHWSFLAWHTQKLQEYNYFVKKTLHDNNGAVTRIKSELNFTFTLYIFTKTIIQKISYSNSLV